MSHTFSSPIMAVPSVYDVFLSFRGTDTRKNFTSHLHKALLDAEISTFFDDDEIEIGGDLKPELEEAIKASRAYIIVFSRNYATSSWCLNELVLILEQVREFNKIVVPIFYHVEQTHVINQRSTFGVAMIEHLQNLVAETDPSKRNKLGQKIEEWSQALSEVSEVANLKGEDVAGRLETEFIEDIVADIDRRLHVPLRGASPEPFGMRDSIKFVTEWLEGTGDILTILGMGGIGKTYLAAYIYGLHCRRFWTRSYIKDISRRCGPGNNGLLLLTKQLYGDISKRRSTEFYDYSICTSKIENIIARKKVFLVLDDINSLDQLNALLGSTRFHQGSKIIITTRDACLTESCELFKTVKPTHVKHQLQGLDDNASRELFRFHAFGSNNPMEGHEKMLEMFVKYCRGHPYNLEVLGKSLYNQHNVAYWQESINKLGKDIDPSIKEDLRMSFDSLRSTNDKDLFKHIACFFVGTDRHFSETILDACDIAVISGIKNLMNKCLLSIGYDNKLVMHYLLQEMGRSLVREESEQSRFWCHEESSKVLRRKMGTKNILGLTLDTKKLIDKRLHEKFKMETDALSVMADLRLLQLNYVRISGSYKNFPKELRWLCMHKFRLKSIPKKLQMENLVALDLSYTNIKSFGISNKNPPRYQEMQELGSKGTMWLKSLKILNLNYCDRLRSLGGFEGLPALESLTVANCISLFKVSDRIEACPNLVLVDLSNCKMIEELPRTIRMLKKVTTLFLDGCDLGEPPRTIHTKSVLSAVKIKFKGKKPSSSAIPQDIPSDTKFQNIFLPRSLVRLSLKDNNLSTESFPMDFDSLSILEELHLDDNPIVYLPSRVRNLPTLEILRWTSFEGKCRIGDGITYKRRRPHD